MHKQSTKKKLNLLLSVIIHDLQNSIGVITGYAYTLLDKDELEEKKKQQFLVNIIQESSHLSQMIKQYKIIQNDLNELLHLKKEQINLRNCLTKNFEILKNKTECSGLRLKNDLTHDFPDILGDWQKLDFAIAGLLKLFTRKPEKIKKIRLYNKVVENYIIIGLVKISLQEQNDDWNQDFRFINNSIPMNNKDILDNTGLFLINSIILKHGGKIGFKKKQGGCGTLYIKLPLIKEA